MKSKTKYCGLCSTCRNDPTCTLPRSPSKPVLMCEEFISCESAVAGTNRTRVPVVTDTDEAPANAIAMARKMGLCSNCEYRENCIFQKAGNAVWYCEEYR